MEREAVSNKKSYHTTEGNKNISGNAVKHGLNNKKYTIMPCRKNCMYKDVCVVFSVLYSEDEQDEDYQLCALEIAHYISLQSIFDSDKKFKGLEKLLIDEFMTYSILRERARRCLSLFPDYLTNNNEDIKYYRYFNRYENKVKKLLNKIINYDNQ